MTASGNKCSRPTDKNSPPVNADAYDNTFWRLMNHHIILDYFERHLISMGCFQRYWQVEKRQALL